MHKESNVENDERFTLFIAAMTKFYLLCGGLWSDVGF